MIGDGFSKFNYKESPSGRSDRFGFSDSKCSLGLVEVSMICLTGDKHGWLGVHDLDAGNWPEGQSLTKDDVLIILGEIGIGMYKDPDRNNKLIQYYESQPWLTAFVDGNHDAFPFINSFPVSEWNGGKVHRIADNVIHLMRGQVFTIEGKKLFVMGGAQSTDRCEGEYWFPEELPSQEEYDEAERNLKSYGYSVDCILTHTCSINQLASLYGTQMAMNSPDPLSWYFRDLEKKVSFSMWAYGHHHRDERVDDRHVVLCHNIFRLTIP